MKQQKADAIRENTVVRNVFLMIEKSTRSCPESRRSLRSTVVATPNQNLPKHIDRKKFILGKQQTSFQKVQRRDLLFALSFGPLFVSNFATQKAFAEVRHLLCLFMHSKVTSPPLNLLSPKELISEQSRILLWHMNFSIRNNTFRENPCRSHFTENLSNTIPPLHKASKDFNTSSVDWSVHLFGSFREIFLGIFWKRCRHYCLCGSSSRITQIRCFSMDAERRQRSRSFRSVISLS